MENETKAEQQAHSCPCCPMEIRNLFAVADNTVSRLDMARSSVGPEHWAILCDKLEPLRRAVAAIRPMMDAHFAATFAPVRAALESGRNLYAPSCIDKIAMYDAALAALTAMQEERRAETLRDAAHVNENGEPAAMLRAECERLRAALGIIARECVIDRPDKAEIYHQCYMALVGDLTLSASEQAEIMRVAMGAAAIGEPAAEQDTRKGNEDATR